MSFDEPEDAPEDFEPPADQPILNRMIEDYLAISTGSEADHAELLKLWIRIGTEYMARAAGRQYTMDSLENMRRFVREARPGRPWKP